jgi:osmoprotectant transport system ATP-binding protein
MIRVENLVKTYNGALAVNNLSFEVPEGENLVLLGTSGCGKTTTLRMINRLIDPDSGTVYINGVDVREQKPEILRRGIGYVLQNHGLFPHYTVFENIAIVPRLLKWKDAAILERQDVLFQKLGLQPELKHKYPAQLSGGQQQRVGLARSLMVNPAILLMDEPFGALDNLTRIGIRKVFRELDELADKTIIMVTHDVQEAFEMGDRVCLIDKGQIVQIGKPEELLFHPCNEFVENFLNEQRLQLELKALPLSALFPGSEDGSKTSVWQRMEELLQANLQSPEVNPLPIEQLMRAFQQYKNR